MDEDLAARLRWYRSQREWTVREAAKASEIHPSSLARYECGERIPTPANLARLSKGYELDGTATRELYLLAGRFPPGMNVQHLRTVLMARPALGRARAGRNTTRDPELAAYNLIDTFKTVQKTVWHRPPVPFQRIAEQILRLSIEYVDFRLLGQGIAGALDRTARTIMIDKRIRDTPMHSFTVAHEMGHWVLHTANVAIRSCSLPSPGSRTEERAADRFAAFLLLPEKMVREEIGKLNEAGEKDYITSVAERFATSIESTRIRLRELGLVAG